MVSLFENLSKFVQDTDGENYKKQKEREDTLVLEKEEVLQKHVVHQRDNGFVEFVFLEDC